MFACTVPAEASLDRLDAAAPAQILSAASSRPARLFPVTARGRSFPGTYAVVADRALTYRPGEPAPWDETGVLVQDGAHVHGAQLVQVWPRERFKPAFQT